MVTDWVLFCAAHNSQRKYEQLKNLRADRNIALHRSNTEKIKKEKRKKKKEKKKRR